MRRGTFNVARAVWDHPAFRPSKFSDREAFLWLLSEAAWRPRRVRIGSEVVDLERGQVCASVRFMAKAWGGWSKSAVQRFLVTLEKEAIIRTEGGTASGVITICNYDKYQGERDSSGTETGTAAGQQRDSSGTKQNSVNPVNSVKKVSSNEGTSPPPEPPGFVDFWDAYAFKKGKGAARKAWLQAGKKLLPERIIAAAADFAAARDPRFIPHPATWLNEERWDDDPTTYQPRKENRVDQSTAADRRHALWDELDRRQQDAAEGHDLGGFDGPSYGDPDAGGPAYEASGGDVVSLFHARAV